MMTDLFWQWRMAPGNLIPIKSNGPWTVTQSMGYHVLWYYDRIIAQGRMETILRHYGHKLAK